MQTVLESWQPKLKKQRNIQKFAVTMWENRHAIVNVTKAVAIAASAVAGYRAVVH